MALLWVDPETGEVLEVTHEGLSTTALAAFLDLGEPPGPEPEPEPEPGKLKACPPPPPPVKSWCCAPEPDELTPVVYPWDEPEEDDGGIGAM